MDKILEEIRRERERQDKLWGTAFDDRNTINDWAAYIGQYNGQAIDMLNSPVEQRIALVKVAALAVAALEAFDRNDGFPPRHYDQA